MKKNCVMVSLTSIALLASVGCSSSSSTSSTTSNPFSTTIASLAVTSPTASRTSTSASLHRSEKTFFAKIKRFFLGNVLASTASTEVEPFSEMVADLQESLTAAPATVAGSVGSLTVTSSRANCYGPTWTDDATGSSVNRPSGDLGMVAAAASATDTNACAAAQLNALMEGAPQFANKVIRMQATMVAALRSAGVDLPAVGATIDALSSMPSFTGITLTAATLTRMSDRTDGNKVYKTVISFTDSDSKTGTITVYHTPTNSDNTEYEGLIQAVLPYTPTGNATGSKRGLSVVYKQDESVLTYALDTAANRGVDSSDFFSSTTGRVDFTKTAFGEDGNRIIASFNSSTNASTMHYAWQAGSADGAVRAFAIDIPAGTEGSLAGVAYFGFGAAITSLTDDLSTLWPSKMYCNWLNGLANGSSVAKVQGQTFSQDTTEAFVPVTSNIAFAPTDTCQKSGSFTISSSSPSTYDGTRTVTTHELVNINGLGTVPAVTVPTYTVPTS